MYYVTLMVWINDIMKKKKKKKIQKRLKNQAQSQAQSISQKRKYSGITYLSSQELACYPGNAT